MSWRSRRGRKLRLEKVRADRRRFPPPPLFGSREFQIVHDTLFKVPDPEVIVVMNRRRGLVKHLGRFQNNLQLCWRIINIDGRGVLPILVSRHEVAGCGRFHVPIELPASTSDCISCPIRRQTLDVRRHWTIHVVNGTVFMGAAAHEQPESEHINRG